MSEQKILLGVVDQRDRFDDDAGINWGVLEVPAFPAVVLEILANVGGTMITSTIDGGVVLRGDAVNDTERLMNRDCMHCSGTCSTLGRRVDRLNRVGVGMTDVE